MIYVGIGFLICLIVATYVMYHSKLKYLSIELKEVEERINSTLIKRKELIKDSEEMIKSIVKTDKEIYQDMDKLNDKDINMIKLDRMLLTYMNEFYLIRDKYQKLQNDDEFQKITFSINETEDLLNAYKEYYNDVSQKYNKLIRSFPVIITTVIKRRKKKEFFDKKSSDDSDELKY